MHDLDILILGAGHNGLAMSGLLADAGRESLVVDRRDTLGGAWQDHWDEFRLVTPNWTTSLPGWRYGGPDPDGFMGRDEIAARVARYAGVVGTPVQLGTEVLRLAPLDGGGLRATTSCGDLTAREVVVATGSYHEPRIPTLAAGISERVTQLHAHAYRNEATLPAGGVLIVGSGQSGLQIAEELAAAGRAVYVSVGSAGRIPRRFRGRDIFGWLADILRHGAAYGVHLPTAEQLPDPRRRFNPMPALSGHDGGHDTNLRHYAAAGMTLAGHLIGADGEQLTCADDLAASLAAADRFFDERFRAIIDAYIERAGIAAPPDDRIDLIREPRGRTDLHVLRERISTIVWATGYRLDHRWIDAPIFDAFGYPRNVRGVTAVPGLYFLGLLWQHSQASASLLSPELDGPYLVERMARSPRAARVRLVS